MTDTQGKPGDATCKQSLQVDQFVDANKMVPEIALVVALESLDQIGAMTKKGRASVHARSTAIFIRTQLEAAQRKEGV